MDTTTAQGLPTPPPKISVTEDGATSAPEPEPAPFTFNAAGAAKTHVAGQAFQSLSFDGEKAIVNQKWAKKRAFQPESL